MRHTDIIVMSPSSPSLFIALADAVVMHPRTPPAHLRRPRAPVLPTAISGHRRDPQGLPTLATSGELSPVRTAFPPETEVKRGEGRGRTEAASGSAAHREDRSRPWGGVGPTVAEHPCDLCILCFLYQRRCLPLRRRQACSALFTDAFTSACGH
jgi:hypothetical protein